MPQLDLFPVRFTETYVFEPCKDECTGEPTGDYRLVVYVNENDPCHPDPRRWIGGIYESSDLGVLQDILNQDHPNAFAEKEL